MHGCICMYKRVQKTLIQCNSVLAAVASFNAFHLEMLKKKHRLGNVDVVFNFFLLLSIVCTYAPPELKSLKINQLRYSNGALRSSYKSHKSRSSKSRKLKHWS